MCTTPALKTLTPGTPVQGSTTMGAPNLINGCLFSDGSAVGQGAPEEVWQLVVPQASGLTLTVAATTWDTAVYLLSGNSCLTAGTFRPNSCADSSGPNQPETVTLDLVPAGTYWVVVDGYVTTGGVVSSGSYTLTATLTPGGGMCTPDALDENDEGDTLGSAVILNGTLANSAGQPTDINLNLCGADEDWFAFYAVGNVTVRAVPQPGYVGTVVTAVQSLTFDAMGAPTGTAYTTGVTAQNGITTITNAPGGTYAIRNTGMGSNATGIRYSFNVVHACEPDGFEEFTGNDLATTAGSPVASDVAAGEVSLRVCPLDVDHILFNSPGTGTATFTLTGGAAFNVTALGVVQNATGVTTGVTMNPAGVTVAAAGADKVVTWTAATAGRLLMLRVEAGSGAVPATGANYGLVVNLPEPNNDLCSSAVNVTLPAVGAAPLVLFGDTAGLGSEQSASGTCVAGGHTTMPQPDVYYTFTAPTPAVRLRASVSAAQYDTVLYVTQGICTTNQVACNDDTSSSSNSAVELNLTPGQQYTVVLDSYEDGAPYALILQTVTPP